MRSNKDEGVRIIFILGVLLCCLTPVRSEGDDDALNVEHHHTEARESDQQTPGHVEQIMEDVQQMVQEIVEDVKQKNSEIVQETAAVFNEESKGDSKQSPTTGEDEKEEHVHVFDESAYNSFDQHGNPNYPASHTSSTQPDQEVDLEYEDMEEDDEDEDPDDADYPDEDNIHAGADLTKGANVEIADEMPLLKGSENELEQNADASSNIWVESRNAFAEVGEVPAPAIEEDSSPGSEDVRQAEEILGLRQTNKPESLDGTMQKPNYRKAYALLQAASGKGNKKAKVLLGFAHLTGDYTPYVTHNSSLALQMFEDAAKSGLPSAQRALGVMYSTGIEANSSQSKALLYYTFASLGGDALAQMALAFRYWSGISVPQSCESALKYYKLVADTVARKVGTTGTGHAVLRIRLMEEEESPQNSPLLNEDLVQYYQFLADKGDLQAQLGLGQLYLQGGRGIDRNVKLSQHYFSAAAKSGNTNAYGYLGKISMQLKEYDMALKYYKLANKDPMGQWGTGTLYYNGWGVDQNYAQALSYFTLAAQQGHTEAELQLGLMHLSGIGVKKDYGIALKHFNIASKSGHVLAFYNLGMMHAKGIGVMRNCQTAAELLKNVAERGYWGNELMDAHALYHKGYVDSALTKYLILAEQGYEVAQTNVAYILDKEKTDFIENLKSRYKRAFVNWKRAAAQGFGGARLKLGDYYYYGQGTEANPAEAAEQYQIASDVDHNPQAMFNLGYMHELGIGRQQDMHLAKRYYDMAASASVDAHVPTMLANIKLQTKLHIEWLIEVYREFTFMKIYDSLLAFYTSWFTYFAEKINAFTEFLVQLDSTATEDWDIYLMSILAIILGLVMALRGHNVRAAQMRAAQQNVPQQRPNQ